MTDNVLTDKERIAVLESEVAGLKSKVAELESDLSEAYSDLDGRIEQITKSRAENIAVFGIAATLIIGVVQILINLVK